MTEAPERIWAWKNNQPGTKYHGLPQWAPFYPTFKTPTVKVFEGTSWWNPFAGTCRDEPVNPYMAEYIRADLVPQWQPIETAPKDGGGVMLGVKINDKFKVFAPCEWSRAGEISEDGFWLWWQSEPEWLTEVRNPTHWMPLPAPPSP